MKKILLSMILLLSCTYAYSAYTEEENQLRQILVDVNILQNIQHIPHSKKHLIPTRFRCCSYKTMNVKYRNLLTEMNKLITKIEHTKLNSIMNEAEQIATIELNR